MPALTTRRGTGNELARADQRRPAVRAKLRRIVVAADDTALGCGCGDPTGFGLPAGEQFLQTGAHRLTGHVGHDDRVRGGQMRPRTLEQAEVDQRHPAFMDEGVTVMERPFDSAVTGIDGKDHGSWDFRDWIGTSHSRGRPQTQLSAVELAHTGAGLDHQRTVLGDPFDLAFEFILSGMRRRTILSWYAHPVLLLKTAQTLPENFRTTPSSARISANNRLRPLDADLLDPPPAGRCVPSPFRQAQIDSTPITATVVPSRR